MTHPAFPFLVNVNVSTFHQNGVAGSHQALQQIHRTTEAQDCVLLGVILYIREHFLRCDVEVFEARFNRLFDINCFANPTPIAQVHRQVGWTATIQTLIFLHDTLKLHRSRDCGGVGRKRRSQSVLRGGPRGWFGGQCGRGGGDQRCEGGGDARVGCGFFRRVKSGRRGWSEKVIDARTKGGHVKISPVMNRGNLVEREEYHGADEQNAKNN